MHHYISKVDPMVINASGPSYRACAQELFGCALNFQSSRSFSPVPYMLLCRALELKLKSHHLETMRPPHVKKKFGHNLSEAYRALPSGLQILSPPELQLLEQANVVYIDDKGFDYVSPKDMITGHSRFPDLQGLIELARKLLAQ